MDGKYSGVLVIIDPQNDFCDRGGSLYVDGAEDDVARLARHISRFGDGYSDIYVSLDSHDPVAIFHPMFWLGEGNEHPVPFTSVTEADFAAGRLRTSRPDHAKYAVRMFRAMARKNIPSFMIWPEHCIISTWGQAMAAPLVSVLRGWRGASGKPVRYVFKGENPYTEQFSIFEGLDDSWPDTAFNAGLCSALSSGGSVTFAGEALSHCVETSITSFVRGGGEAAARVKKFVLADCASPVAGFSRSESEDRLASLGVNFIPSGA